MINEIKHFIDFIGVGNTISIIIFLLGSFLAFYFYFKTFYRLVYSSEKICETCNNVNDWVNKDNLFRSRVLFLNNGRKTLTKEEIKKLEINSTGKILNVRVLIGTEKLKKPNLIKNKFEIELEYLDSSEFILLEITHKGFLNIEGRISETGQILHTETRSWLIINFVFILFFFGVIFYNIYVYIYSNPELNNVTQFGINLIILFGIYMVIRYIHKLFFIPDNISFKYLDVKDKWNREFRNEL